MKKISRDSLSATSLPESESGVTRLEKLDGQTTFLFGQDPVPAHHSVQAGSGKASAIRVTCGPHGAGSFKSVSLSLSLASRLRKKTDTLGSTLYLQNWKQKATPSGRRIYQLVASARPISVTGFTSWPTPTALSFADSHRPGNNRYMNTVTKLVGWSTPNGDDANNGTRVSGEFKSLTRDAHLTGWVSPSARDWKDTPGMSRTGKKNRKRLDQLPRQAHLTDSGKKTPSGSTAKTKHFGLLDPAFSLWLMGLPIAWVVCGERVTPLSRRRRRRS